MTRALAEVVTFQCYFVHTANLLCAVKPEPREPTLADAPRGPKPTHTGIGSTVSSIFY